MAKQRLARLCVAVLAAACAARAAEAALPGDCVAVLKFEGVNTTTKQFGELMAQVQPGLSAPAMTAFMGQQIMNPALAGIDRTRPWWVVFANPQTYGREPAIAAPVADQAAVKAAFGPGLANGAAADGVTTFTNAAGAAVVVGFAGKYVVVSQSKPVCVVALGMLKAGQLEPDLIPLRPKRAVAAGALDVAKLWGGYKLMVVPMIDGFKAMLQQQLAAAEQAGKQPPGQAAHMVKIVGVEIELGISFLDQLDGLSFGLAAGKQGIDLHSQWDFKPGTPIAKFLAAQKPQAMKLIQYLPPDVMAGGSVRVEFTPELVAWYFKFIDDEIAGAVDAEAMAAVKQIMKRWVAAMGKEIAFALTVPMGDSARFEEVQIAELKSNELGRAAYRDMMEHKDVWAKYMTAMGQQMTIDLQNNVGQYKGLDIHRQVYKWEYTNMAAQGVAMQQKIFGDELVAEGAFVKNLYVLAYGPNAHKRLQEAVDLALGGKGDRFTTTLPYQTLFPADPQDQSMVGYVSPGDLITWLGQAIPMMANVDYDSSFGVGLTARMSGHSITTRVIVPMEEVLAARRALGPPAPGGPAPK